MNNEHVHQTLDNLHYDLISKIQKSIDIFVYFFHCHKKVQDNKDFSCENSNPCHES